MPVKTTQEPDVGETQEATASVLRAGGSSSAGSTTSSFGTPLAELSQLDATLQEMDINPQSISLFNRMAMLLYANDPAALRELVQTLQQGAQQAGTTAPDGGSGKSQMSRQGVGTSLLPGQSQGLEAGGSDLLSGRVGGQSQLADAQLQLAAKAQANVNQSPVGSNGSAGTNAPACSATAEAQNVAATSQSDAQTSLSVQVGEFRSIFAVIAGNGSAMEDQFALTGQTLDVSA